jgi:putative transposase
VLVNLPHHITQRGNNGQDLFKSDQDYRVYLNTIFEHAPRYGLGIWGYCLMPNHVHLIAVPRNPHGLARVFGRTHSDYARYANAVRGGCGHLFQARFYSCPMDGGHTWRAMVYVERNPVRAGLVRFAEAYPWSSARVHSLGDDPRERLEIGPWQNEFTTEHWRQALHSSLGEAELSQRLREATSKGRPLGSEDFIDRASAILGRELRPRTPGRPKKSGPAPLMLIKTG